MAVSDPDFIHLIDANRFQPTKDITSPTVQRRLQKEKNAYANENISLRLVPNTSSSSSTDNATPSESSATTTATTWNIPRFRLTDSFLTETVNRGRSTSTPLLIVSHLIDSKTKTVILPCKDMQGQMRSSPVVYDIITHVAGGIKQGGVLAGVSESFYKGDLIFATINIPKRSKSELFEVLPTDVHRWLVQGALSDVEKIKIATNKLINLKESLTQLEKDVSHVPTKPIYNSNGRAIVGSALQVAREVKLKSLQEGKEQTMTKVAKAEQSLELARARHFEACKLTITEQRIDEYQNAKSISFLVKLSEGKKKEYYTNLITNKADWCRVPMYATGNIDSAATTFSKKNNKYSLEVNIDESDLAQHFVDVGSVSIVMLPDGFGVHEHYAESDPFSTSTATANGEDGNAKGHHILYHGHFDQGEYSKGTLHTDEGVFTGTFTTNQPCNGKMKYADGTTITGGFALHPTCRGDIQCSNEVEEADAAPLGPNPYRQSSPHGNVNIQYKGGASYEGEMKYGAITGHGRYESSKGSTMEGTFANGVLQGSSGVEGQGGSNMARSIMFGGERLWGPSL